MPLGVPLMMFNRCLSQQILRPLLLLLGLLGAIACSRGVPEAARRPGKSDKEIQPMAKQEVAVLAGGCFWGMQDILRKIPGVVETQVGYAGGNSQRPTYEDVKGGDTGHAESVRVVFDPDKLAYADLLEKWFFRMHDPTTKNRQGNDVGTQYRSVIFVHSPEQRKTAEQVMQRVEQSGKWKKPLTTEVLDARTFTPAEDYHQDYLQKNPGGYTCHWLRDWT
jgi:peptide methionine sulfoxide reductase msrA/msrB